jgi:hypothetical protein
MTQANRVVQRGYIEIVLHQLMDTWQAMLNKYDDFILPVS